MVIVADSLVETCKRIIQETLKSQNKTWVLFEHDTFVILDDPVDNIATASTKASEIMKEYGPVHAGCSAGDFDLFEDKESNGWVVTGHCPNMFTYVGKDEAKEEAGGAMMVGLLGRSKRGKDGKNPNIVHVELV